jgi:polysaccharide pyruvyl transferase WcaK-like protein
MKIFVFGWYGHGNLGDEAFKAAISKLFPQYQFTFRDSLPEKINQEYDQLWVGGGSFLDQVIKGIEKVTIPIGFIGVGIGHTVDRNNLEAMGKARFVIVRDHVSVKRCPHAYLAPDLVFSRKDIQIPKPKAPGSQKIAAVLLNDFFTPGWNSHEWQSLSFYRFAQECAKVCESLTSKGYKIHFVPMCLSPSIDDRKVAAAIIGRMKSKGKVEWCLDSNLTEERFLEYLAKSDLVITQRLHGAIYSILLDKPFIVLRAHDKLRGLVEDCDWPGHLDYYGFTDEEFFKVFKRIGNTTVGRDYLDYAQKRWSDLAQIIVRSNQEDNHVHNEQVEISHQENPLPEQVQGSERELITPDPDGIDHDPC